MWTRPRNPIPFEIFIAAFVIAVFTVSQFAQKSTTPAYDDSTYLYWQEKGIAEVSEKDFEDAINSFTKCLGLDKNNVQCLLKRGISYSRTKKYSAAIADLDKVIALEPDLAEAYLERGKLAIGNEEEIRYFTKAIKLKPDYADAYYQRGLTYFLSDSAKSLADNSKAIELDPENFEAHITRGNILRLDGKLSQALADYSKAVEIHPDDRTYYIRGQMYLEMKFFNRAVEDLTRSAELRPDYYWTYINRAKAYRGLRKLKLARADEKRAAQIGRPQ